MLDILANSRTVSTREGTNRHARPNINYIQRDKVLETK